jgi:endogenous inhibitor of DNA gyrase (YacG/DUF329 family)
MFVHKTCPWCQKRLAWPTDLRWRPSSVPPRWYQSSRGVAVCPFCGKRVKLSRRGKIWLLLVVPIILYPVFFHPMSDLVLAVLMVLGLVGGTASNYLSQLEKDHAA